MAARRSGAHRIADWLLKIGWQRGLEADGPVTADAQYDVTFVVQHLAVEAAVVSWTGDGEQFRLGSLLLSGGLG
jgi:hypothetical protein